MIHEQLNFQDKFSHSQTSIFALHTCHLFCHHLGTLYRVKRNLRASVMQRHFPLVKIIKLYPFTYRISTTAIRVTGSLQGMCFELQPGNFYLKKSSLFEFFGVYICVDENPVLCDIASTQWMIAVEHFKHSVGGHFDL
jgi:hypothetical protein